MTKDEFLDIMGKIDEELIDSTFDNSQVKVIKLESERPSVMRYIMSIAACVAALVTVVAVGYFKGIELPSSPGETEEQSSSKTVITDSESSAENEAVGINPDVVWGLGKTFDEISKKYGDVKEGNFNTYTFKNGYGIYIWKNGGEVNYENSNVEENIEATKKRGGCDIIDGIKASDFLNGSISTLSYDEFAEKYGINFTKFAEPAMDNCYWGYFKHPSYDVTFAVYTTEKDKIDENAHFVIGMNENIW